MARRRVYWHIGLDDLGTTFVAHALDNRRAELAAHGVQVRSVPAAAHSVWLSSFDEFVAALPELFTP